MPTLYVFNTRSLAKPAAIDHLYLEFKQHKIDVGIITETWLSHIHAEDMFAINEYTLIRKDRNLKKGGGIAVYINNKYEFERVFTTDYQRFEVLWVKIKNRSENIYIAAIYHPPTNYPYDERDLLDTLSDTIATIKSEAQWSSIFICGDINTLNKNDLESTTDLKQIVQEATRGSNILDVIFTNSDYLYEIPFIFNSIAISDHKAIVYKPKVLQESKKQRHCVTFRDTRDHHKSTFIGKIKNIDWTSFYMVDCPDKLAITFTSTLHKIFDESFPLRKVSISDRDPWWMTPLIKYWLHRRTNAKKKNKFALLDRINSRLRILIEKSKVDNLTASLSNCHRGNHKWWTLIKTFSKIEPSKNSNNNSNLTAEKLNDFFQNISIDQNYKYPDRIATCCNLKVNVSEVLKELNDLKKTSPGPSLIPYWVYKEHSGLLAPLITHMINNCLIKGMFPHILKKELITPIPKIKRPTDPSDFRPVAVTDVLSRIMERILLKLYVKEVKLHSKNEQHGFFNGRSTTSALISFHYKVNKILESHDYARILITDLSKAFNKVRHSSCVQSLIEKNVNPSIINLVGSFLTGRQNSTCFNKKMSQWKNTSLGIGQGTIQGPILFNSAFDMVSLSCCHIRYADDLIMILKPSENPEGMLEEMQLGCENIGLEMNPKKTFEMIIHKKNRSVNIQTTNGITPTNTIKYLGINITKNFSMNLHCKEVIASSNKILFLLNRLKNIGMKSDSLTLLFESLLLSKMTYGIEFWWPLLNNREKEILQKILKKANRRSIIESEPDLKSLAMKRMNNLLMKVKMNNEHILHGYLPPVVREGRRAGELTVNYSSTCRDQKLFFNYLSLQHYQLR